MPIIIGSQAFLIISLWHSQTGFNCNDILISILNFHQPDKPTCSALHLHSLDMATKSQLDNGIKNDLGHHQFETNFIQSGSYIKPAKATNHDEYAIVRETSEDFITLRKKLVLSPLLNRQSSRDEQGSELSFKDSIFQSILYDKGSQSDGGETLKSSSSDQYNRVALTKYRDALANLDTKSDTNNQLDNMLVVDGKLRQNDGGHSWNRFNSLLLNFLNNYMKEVKIFEEQLLINNESNNLASNANQQLTRRSSSNQQSTNEGDGISLAPKGSNELTGKENTRNLITFACMAQDGNPMSNLTFDWSFGSTNLPETDEPFMSSPANHAEQPKDRKDPLIKPQLVYVNDNYTLQVMLVRRLDTRSSLNPFQMSLLTLNIVVEPLASLGGPANRATRQSEFSPANRTSSLNNHSNLIPRAPVIRGRQPAHYNSLKAVANQNSISNNNNIQFARELEMRPYNLGAILQNGIDLNEENWQEQISNLLRCTVTNRIGTSEVCHARVNLAERLKSSTSASSEFAKWRMPSLAHKSILIISITVGCMIVVFVTFALLISSYIKNLNLKGSGDLRCCKQETNTGQSASSQKSSVLGLLGNGDSSLQSSSDDDSSARLNHHHHHLQHNHAHHHHAQDNLNLCQNRTRLDLRDSSLTSQTLTHSESRESSANYDQPRGLHEPPAVYHNSAGFNERTPDRVNNETLDSYNYRNELASVRLPMSQDSQILNAPDLNNQNISTRGRLLANLKSLSKFKVDRISDLTNFPSRVSSIRAIHTKNVSSSGTNTTGLSVSAFDSDLNHKLESPQSSGSPTFFEAPVQPQNYFSYKAQQMGESFYHMHTQNGLLNDPDDSTAKLQMQLNSQRLLNSNLAPAYSNMINNKSLSPLDEYIRQRELDPLTVEQNNSTTFYRSQSNRNHHLNSSNPQPMYLMRNDLSQFHPQQVNRGPPIYPRSNQASTLYKLRLAEEALRPSATARSASRQIIDSSSAGNPQQYQSSRVNRLSVPSNNQSFTARPSDIPPVSTLSYMNTIDSHLNRVSDTIAVSQYPGNHQNLATTYVNTAANGNDSNGQQGAYNSETGLLNQSAEHIYDTNAYATPEQTPMRANLTENRIQIEERERPRVHHLIQTFNSRAPPPPPE